MALSEIYEELRCTLRERGMLEPLVFGMGNENADILLLGEAPGGEEIKQNRPFVGKAGKNLDLFLRRIGLSRDDIYITNVVKFRPCKAGKAGRKSNRPPNKVEIALCRACLLRELEFIQPKLIVTLGNTALGAVAGEPAVIGKVHGSVLKTNSRSDLFALYHPASVIYNQSLLSAYMEDIRLLKAYIEKNLSQKELV